MSSSGFLLQVDLEVPGPWEGLRPRGGEFPPLSSSSLPLLGELVCGDSELEGESCSLSASARKGCCQGFSCLWPCRTEEMTGSTQAALPQMYWLVCQRHSHTQSQCKASRAREQAGHCSRLLGAFPLFTPVLPTPQAQDRPGREAGQGMRNR